MLNGVGINPYTANNRRLCKGASNKATEFHHENKSLDIDEGTKTNTMCRKFINDHGILFGQEWNKVCKGKKSCGIKVDKSNYNYFSQSGGFGGNRQRKEEEAKICFHDNSDFFIQYTCE